MTLNFWIYRYSLVIHTQSPFSWIILKAPQANCPNGNWHFLSKKPSGARPEIFFEKLYTENWIVSCDSIEKGVKKYFIRHTFPVKTVVEQISCVENFQQCFFLVGEEKEQIVVFFKAKSWFPLNCPHPKIDLLNLFSFWHVTSSMLQMAQ